MSVESFRSMVRAQQTPGEKKEVAHLLSKIVTATDLEAQQRRANAAVIDGEIKNLSLSQIAFFNPEEDGCNRKWYRKYVLRDKREQTDAAKAGDDFHKDIEQYLKGGPWVATDRILAGKHFIPAPGPDLKVEHKFGGDVLYAIGIPVNGKIDLLHNRGIVVNDDGGTMQEKYGQSIAEVLDWKTTSNIAEWGKAGADLIKTSQMIGYGKVAQVVYPHIKWVRLSHGYFQTRGRRTAEKHTSVIHVDVINSQWQSVEAIAREMVHVAREAEFLKVPPNFDACSAYGGCPYLEHCPRSAEQAAIDLFGKGSSMSLLARRPGAAPAAAPAQTALAPAPVATAPAAGGSLLRRQLVSTPLQTVGQPAPAVNAEVQRLAQNQAAAMQGNGTPSYSSLPAAPGLPPAPVAVQTSHTVGGVLCCYPCNEPLHQQNASQLPDGTFKHIGCKAQPAQVLPPDAPQSQPHLAAQPVPGEAVLAQTPAVQAAIAQHNAAAAQTAPPAAPATPARRGGRRKAQTVAEHAPPAHVTHNASAQGVLAPQSESTEDSDDRIILFINTCVEGVEVEDLGEYLHNLCARLCHEYQAADVRCAPETSPLAFGKWKGALAALIRANPPLPGMYLINIGDSEMQAVLAETLRELASIYVRGVR